MIESARLMTNEELANYRERIFAAYRDKKGKAIHILEAKEGVLLQEYARMEEACREEYRQDLRDLLQKKRSFDEMICLECGAKLRLIQTEYSNFYGCTAYRDGQKHTTFQVNYASQFLENFRRAKVRIDSNWLTDLLKATGLRLQVAASALLDFLLSKGYEDLREKYGYTKTKDRIFGFARANKESSKEEKEIHAFLQRFFPKVDSQRGVLYKLTGEKERVAILDTIVSTTSLISIVEVKRNVYDIREDQLSLYQQLIQHVLHQGGDTRTIQSLFLIYNTPEFVPGSHYPRYLLFDILKKSIHLTEVLALFCKVCFRNP